MTKGRGNQKGQNKNRKNSNEKTSNDNKISFLSNEQNYRETLQVSYRYMLQLAPQREWMKYKFGLRIRNILDKKHDIKVLAVGTGSGEVDIDFVNEIVKCGIERLGETGYSVEYQVVEPSPSNIEFLRNTVTQDAKYNRIKFKWFTGTFEKFCDDFKPQETESNKFDFIHFSRVFYHTDSVKAFDQTCNHLLANNGTMCAIGENEGFWPKMMTFLANHKMEHEMFKCSGPISTNYFLPGWIKQAYDDTNWRYESYVHSYNFDVTPMYEPSSKDGNDLMDFAFHVKNARKVVKRNHIDDFFRMLDEVKIEKEVSVNGVNVQKKYFPCELGTIMITKE